ncbi:P4 family phage/plasmid primase-like protein [Salinibacter ruber]|nr:P4 family phage/plasmid primase-like protein [Salinibacter ruber]
MNGSNVNGSNMKNNSTGHNGSFNAHINQNGGSANGNSEPDDSTIHPESWKLVRKKYDRNKGEGRMRASDLLIQEMNLATHRESGRLYAWDDDKKVYRDDGEESIRERLVGVLRGRFTQHEVSEILGMVKPKTYREEFGADGFVPVANGDLEVKAGAVNLVEATPDHGFRNRSSAEWDPDADAPIFQAYLRQAVKTEEERKTLQEYAGYSLMYWGLPFHKALFLVGPQASGKSTFLSALQEMLGKTTQLSPQQLVDDEYGAIELEDSWANIASDIPSSLLSNVGQFKEITAGDRIHARRIYEQGYTIRPTAKHFYSANQLPEIKIDDNAFFRRVMIVAFPETVDREDRDPKLGQKLKLEIDGILRWAVEGLQRLLENEDFTQDLTPQETRRLWDEHASSIGQFKARCLTVTGDSNHAVSKDKVYSAYSEFCAEEGLPTESQRKLTRMLKRDPHIDDAQRTPSGFSSQVRCYTGAKLVGDKNDVPL